MELEQGIVLKTIDYQENSKIIYLLTKTGIKSAIVRAAKSLKSHTFSYAQPLVKLDFELKNNRYIGSYKIIDNYNNIKLDLDKLKYGLQVIELCYNLGEHISDHNLFYDFTADILDAINNYKVNYDAFELIFKIKSLYLLGVAPVFNKCVVCGTRDNLKGFAFNSGGMKCVNCIKAGEFIYPEETVKMIRVMYLVKFNDLCNLIKNKELVYDYNKISRFLELYYDQYLGFKSNVDKVLK